jgi:hypothetical protein
MQRKSQEEAMRGRRIDRRSMLAAAGFSLLVLVGRLAAQQVQPAPAQRDFYNSKLKPHGIYAPRVTPQEAFRGLTRVWPG